jgi:enamine deaminase RidA (YjgF/YER057c/UK114 family)
MLASNAISRSAPPWRVEFAGAPGAAAAGIRIETPWLAGSHTEELFAQALDAGSEHGVRLYRSGGLLLGHAREPFVAEELSARTEKLYRRILNVTQGRHLYRIWNYVPQINAHTAGLENYRAFCQGRSLAFEALHGGEFQPRLPAASAVGCTGQTIEAIFAAGIAAPQHFENPEQVPAYRYPSEHGPRAPSFARATVARDEQRTFTFISGTAAIKGHQTIAPGALELQVDCTLDNLRLVSRTAGLGDDLGAKRTAWRHFKVYLRDPASLRAVQSRLDAALLRSSDTVTYLHAEICRAALKLEIEMTIVETLPATARSLATATPAR